MKSFEHKVCTQCTLALTVRLWVVCDCPLPLPCALSTTVFSSPQEGFGFHGADGLTWRPALPLRAQALEQTRISLPAPLAGGLGPIPQPLRISFLRPLQHMTTGAGAKNSTHLFSYRSGGQKYDAGLRS